VIRVIWVLTCKVQVRTSPAFCRGRARVRIFAVRLAVPYRNDPHAAPVVATTFAGKLKLEIQPKQVTVATADRTLTLTAKSAVVLEMKKPKQPTTHPLAGRVVTARGVPRGELAVWIETADGMLRIFDAVPRGLLEHDGLAALRSLDQLARELHAAMQSQTSSTVTGVEIGTGLDRVLIVETDDGIQLFERRLFRRHCRLLLQAWHGGKLVIYQGAKSVTVNQPWGRGITVQADYICFFDRDGQDMLRVAIPWVVPEDRQEIARRIGAAIESNLSLLAIGPAIGR
jgi:hypothetical protein